jgi:DNA-binding transcriptional MerR regulator
MSSLPEAPEYSIAAVSKLTGVSCHALRVWERRYGFPVPHRSASGHRRYSRDQVRILRRVAVLAQTGQSIGDLVAAAREGRLPADEPLAPHAAIESQERPGELVDRLIAGDLEGAEAVYGRLAARLDQTELITGVIEPALVDVGERWFRRECDVFQERSVSHFVRGKLEIMIHEARLANQRPAHTLLAGTVEGDRHFGGVLMLHLVLEKAGWRVLNMGVDLPVREYQKAVSAWRPEALGLSFVLSRNINKRFQELSQIRGLPIFVGGRSILNYQSLARRNGLIPIAGPITSAVSQLLSEFDEWTRSVSPPAGGS